MAADADVATDQNPWAMRARNAKVKRLADALAMFEATPEEVAEMSEAGWAAAAVLADVPYPSETTKRMVVGYLSIQQGKAEH